VRTTSKVLVGVAALLLLLLSAVAIAVWTLDANALAAPLRQRIKDATGREFAVDGGVELKLSFAPKLVLHDVRLANARWGRAPQLVTSRQAEAQVALLPLLSGKVDVVRFALVEPVIALETNREGRHNWDFESSAATPRSSGAALPPAGAAAFAIGNVEITKGVLSYRDGATDNVTKVAIDSLTLKTRDPQSALVTSFRGSVGGVAVSVEGDLGSLDALRRKQWPWPVRLHGDISGRKLALSTGLAITGDTTSFEALDLALGGSHAKGEVRVTTGGVRTKHVVHLDFTELAMSDWMAMAAAMPAAPMVAAPVSARSAYVIPDETFDLSPLDRSDAEGEIRADVATLLSGRRIEQLHVRFALADGKLQVPALEAALFGGTFTAALTIDARNPALPTLSATGNGHGFDLGAILAAAGWPREVRGGKTDVVLDLHATGASPHRWASSMSGSFRAVAGPATLSNGKVGLGSVLDRLADAVNPFRMSNPVTELKCAVVRLPLANGVARIDRSIAFETAQLGVAVDGTLDFRNETLDLALIPHAKQKLPIDIPQLADLVRFRGPFAAPVVHVDAAGSALAIAKIGAALGTGGLSMAAESLLSRSGGAETCAMALGNAPPARNAANGVAPRKGSADGGVGQLLDRLRPR
jgi:uncharacterized protein involved in outer membrane biogenesis